MNPLFVVTIIIRILLGLVLLPIMALCIYSMYL